MITRIYASNYKSLVNFELKLESLQVIVGQNGVGKSTVFEVIHALQGLVSRGDSVAGLFPASCLNRFMAKDSPITIEADVFAGGSVYHYAVAIELRSALTDGRLASETLNVDGRLLFQASLGLAALYDDKGERRAENVQLDWTRSGLSLVRPGPDNRHMEVFKAAIGRIVNLQPNPFDFRGDVSADEFGPDISLDRRCTNLAGWLRHLFRDFTVSSQVVATWRELIDGFESFALLPVAGGGEELYIKMGGKAGTADFRLNELSEGQRALLLLGAIMSSSAPDSSCVLIDEPDNFVAPFELNWLVNEVRRKTALGAQFVFITHHPELVNALLPDHGITMTLTDEGFSRAMPFQGIQGMAPAEQLARNWEA